MMTKSAIHWYLMSVLAVVGLAPTAWAQAGLTDAEELGAAELYEYWRVSLPLAADSRIIRAEVVDENLYCITAAGDVLAVQVDVGMPRWTYHLVDDGTLIYGPTHSYGGDEPGPAIFAIPNEVLLIDRKDGNLVKSLQLPYVPGSPAAATPARVYTGGLDGFMTCTRINDPRFGIPVKLWEVRADGPIVTAPVFLDTSLFFGSQDGTIYSCQAANKSKRWIAKTGMAVLADFHVDDSGVYVACTDRSLYRFDVNTGELLWRVRTPGTLRSPPTKIQETVYQYSPREGLMAIDVHDAKIIWTRPEGRTIASVDRGVVNVLTSEGQVLGIEIATGEVRYELSTPDVDFVATNRRSAAMYLVSRDGRVTCIQPRSVPFLRASEVLSGKKKEDKSDTEKTSEPQPPKEKGPDVYDDPLRSKIK